MKTQFVVTDAGGNVSWNDKTEEPETFKTFAAAEGRAKELAETDPGRIIHIYSLAGRVAASVSAPALLK